MRLIDFLKRYPDGWIVNATKSPEEHRWAHDRDPGLSRRRSIHHRIRPAMIEEDNAMLQRIGEAGVTSVGGKPRRGNSRFGGRPGLDGRHTHTLAVIGAVDWGAAWALAWPPIPRREALVGYPTATWICRDRRSPRMGISLESTFGTGRLNAIINHRISYPVGLVHTNSVERFGSLRKRPWHATPHRLEAERLPLYIAESVGGHNHRRDRNAFGSVIREAMAW